ncbi:SPOR domain-containing protein [soil metagenome]
MATMKSKHQTGGTLLGFRLGLVIGLAIAAGVAVFVTKAPLPFVSRGGPRAVDAPLPPGTPVPDPNKPLYGRDTTPVPPPGAPAGTPAADPDRKFSFYDVAPNNTAPTAPPAAAVDPAKPAARAPGAEPPRADAIPADDGKTRYLLQAGAFKAESDAEAMKARLALLGLSAQVSSADRDGGKVYRVRIGPGRADDVNRMKQTLAQNGIDASLVRVTP